MKREAPDRIDCAICHVRWKTGEMFVQRHPRFGTAHLACIQAVLDAEALLPNWNTVAHVAAADVDAPEGTG